MIGKIVSHFGIYGSKAAKDCLVFRRSCLKIQIEKNSKQGSQRQGKMTRQHQRKTFWKCLMMQCNECRSRCSRSDTPVVNLIQRNVNGIIIQNYRFHYFSTSFIGVSQNNEKIMNVAFQYIGITLLRCSQLLNLGWELQQNNIHVYIR